MEYHLIENITKNLLLSCQREQYEGYDPFDSLNSKLLQATPFYKNSFIRLAWLQLGKRSPINLRRLLMVPKKRNPKGIGLFILGLLEDYKRSGDESYLTEAVSLADWLIDQRSNLDEWQHSCWGYHFDWQARAFYVPKGKPNIITTVYVSRALFELGKVVGNKEYCDIALNAAYFISNKLFTNDSGRSFYAYIPGETAFVHNASLWGAAWCVFAAKELGDSNLLSQALDVARLSANGQGDDGSWVYGARHHHQFIDGFHTGYNLEALTFIGDVVGGSEFDQVITKGYRYYLDNFFTSDGTCKYYNNNMYPLDMHSVSQAVFTLLKVGGEKSDLLLCEKILKRAIELLYIPKNNQFMYQKNKWFSNKINYARWTQAWAYYSLAFYNRVVAENEKN